MKKSPIPEEFLHFLWQTQRYDWKGLKTTTGETVTVLKPGHYNQHAGPDFLQARIQLNDTVWAGHVEMHVYASDWLAHGHQTDPAYRNVVLHVVLEEDTPIRHPSGERIPCVELRRRIPFRLLGRFRELRENLESIPCRTWCGDVSSLIWTSWMDNLAVERLEEKSSLLHDRLAQNKGDWEATFYQAIARNLGYHVNASGFEQLTAHLPLALLRKYRTQSAQLEALLFGQAGWLQNPWTDEYPRLLAREYAFLSHKHQLRPLPPAIWRFSRMRPSNFPSVRMAQLAALIHHLPSLWSSLLECFDLESARALLQQPVSQYWRTHYFFDRPTREEPRVLGDMAADLLLINTICPMLFLYGQRRQEIRFADRALAWLEQLAPEDNRILKRWKKAGVEPQSAMQSQALLQLWNRYCQEKRCLQCRIGAHLLRDQD